MHAWGCAARMPRMAACSDPPSPAPLSAPRLQLQRSAPASAHGLPADPDGAVHEGAGGEHHRARAEGDAEKGAHARDLVVGAHVDTHRHALPDEQVRRVLQQPPHLARVLQLVRLRAQRPHRGALQAPKQPPQHPRRSWLRACLKAAQPAHSTAEALQGPSDPWVNSAAKGLSVACSAPAWPDAFPTHAHACTLAHTRAHAHTLERLRMRFCR